MCFSGNCGRSLFNNYINPIGFCGPKPNYKIIKSANDFVRTIKQKNSKENLRNKKCSKCLLECEGKISIFVKFLHGF